MNNLIRRLTPAAVTLILAGTLIAGAWGQPWPYNDLSICGEIPDDVPCSNPNRGGPDCSCFRKDPCEGGGFVITGSEAGRSCTIYGDEPNYAPDVGDDEGCGDAFMSPVNCRVDANQPRYGCQCKDAGDPVPVNGQKMAERDCVPCRPELDPY